jgi:hypothetical protein
VPLKSKVGLLSDGGQCLRRKAGINLDDPPTPYAGDVVMVAAGTTDAVAVCAVRKHDAVKQPQLNKHVHRPEYRCASKLRIHPL